MNIVRRKLFKDGLTLCSLLLLPSLKSGSASETISRYPYPLSAFQAQRDRDALLALFGDGEAAEDASIDITLPIEAEHAGFVPFQVIAPGAEKIALFVDSNTQPLTLVYCLHPGSGHHVRGTLKLEKSSVVTCYTYRENQVFKASRFVRTTVGGYGV